MVVIWTKMLGMLNIKKGINKLKLPVVRRLHKYTKKAGAFSRFVSAFLMLLFYVRFHMRTTFFIECSDIAP